MNLDSIRPAEVLLVEDNDTDVLLMRKSFQCARLAVNLHHVSNGEQCLAFLGKEAGYEDAPTPDLILLDLNMPIMDGRETLAKLVADDRYSHLPVVVLTTSNDERDVFDMYQLRCSAYLTKPVDFVNFQELVQQLGQWWFTLVVLPPNANEHSSDGSSLSTS